MRALITGGGGFLGNAIARQWIASGNSAVSLSRQSYETLKLLGVDQIRGDIADPVAVTRAAAGCDCVFHVAAKAGMWGDYNSFYTINVQGTKNVIDTCRMLSIPKLIYTSSPSVVFNGKDQEGINESTPYPTHFEAPYPQTKALAEQDVLNANSPTLATVALRPHLIWGPNDNHLLPRLESRARRGQLRRIGMKTTKIDTVHVENAAHAHIIAAQRLSPKSSIAGKTYFISQGQPIETWTMVNRLLEAVQAPLVTKSVPYPIALMAAHVFEFCHRSMKLPGEPRLTRFVVRELATSHWFNIEAARNQLGYNPVITLDDGIQNLHQWARSRPNAA